MNKINRSNTVINKGFIVQKRDNNTALFDPETSQLYTLNESASFIFNLLKKGESEKDIPQKLVKKYKISKERARIDTDKLLKDLFKKEILRRCA